MKPLGYFYSTSLTENLRKLEELTLPPNDYLLLIELAANRAYYATATPDERYYANSARNTLFKRLPQHLSILLSDIEDDPGTRWSELIPWLHQ